MRMTTNAWRSVLAVLGGALLSSITNGSVWAQQNEVKVGLIAPISGPWARQGELMLKGAQLAVDDINA